MVGRSIWNRYNEIMLIPNEELEFNEDEQAVDTLFEDDWIRILLIRKRNSDEIIIEVELSIPGESSNAVKNSSAHDLLMMTLHRLKFIQKLGDKGFSIQLVDRDWIWSASMELLDSNTSLDFFESLEPPSST